MIEARQRTVYFSQAAGRHFMTKRAAALAEARQIILRKYPSEPFDEETGDGFYWKDGLPRSDVLYRRLTRLVLKGMK